MTADGAGSEPGAAPALPDWGTTGPVRPVKARTRGLAVALAAAAIAGAAGGMLGLSGALAAVAGAVTALALWVAALPRRALRKAGARRAAADEAPRLVNIVTGLARTIGIDPPDVRLIDAGGPNAIIGRMHGHPVLAVTRSLLESYSRTELEAVAAHCLVRVASGGVASAMWIAAFGSDENNVGPAEDARAAALTRYPPALARAIERAEPHGGREAPFWFVGRGLGHVPVVDRLEAIAEL